MLFFKRKGRRRTRLSPRRGADDFHSRARIGLVFDHAYKGCTSESGFVEIDRAPASWTKRAKIETVCSAMYLFVVKGRYDLDGGVCRPLLSLRRSCSSYIIFCAYACVRVRTGVLECAMFFMKGPRGTALCSFGVGYALWSPRHAVSSAEPRRHAGYLKRMFQ